MASDIDICNRSLSRLGMPRITALSDATESGYACSSAWLLVRDEVLRAHPWNCATVRKTLSEVAAKAIISTDNLNPLKVACTGHAYIAGQRIFITGVATMTEINDKYFRVSDTSLNANDFRLEDEELVDVDGTSYTDGTGGTVRAVPDWDYGHMYALPTDCLRLLEVQDLEENSWVVENGFILCDEDETIHVRYIKKEEDESKYDPLLVSALAARLTVELMEELPELSGTKRQLYEQQYQQIMLQARMSDGQEGSSKGFRESSWVLARY